MKAENNIRWLKARIDEALFQELKIIAVKENKTITEIINNLIAEYVKGKNSV